MNIDLTDDQVALRDTLRDFFENEAPVAVVRAAEPLGFDATLWSRFAKLGMTSVAVPEDRGGGGAGVTELAIAAELLGRSLAPVPLIEAAVATGLLASLPVPVPVPVPGPGTGTGAAAGGDAPAAVVGGAVAGDELGAVVEGAVAGDLLVTLALHPAGDVARLVPAGAVADVVVVRRGDDLVLVRRPDTPRPAVPNLGAVPVATVPVPADAPVVASGPAAVAAHRRAVARWRALTAAALSGLGARALEIGVDYVKDREAFGVAVGSFQSVQHRLADDATALEGARLLAYKSGWAQDVDHPQAGELATMAFLFAAETAFRTASDSLHVHGGYGYTLEYDIQLYFRRAKAWALAAGDPRPAYAALAHDLFAHDLGGGRADGPGSGPSGGAGNDIGNDLGSGAA